VHAANFDQLESERLDLGEDAVERCLIGQRASTVSNIRAISASFPISA